MLRVTLTSFAAIALMGMAGCATLLTGNSAPVSVNSVPAGANVEIRETSGRIVDSKASMPFVQKGLTPMSVKLTKGKEYTVTISLEGYQTITRLVAKGNVETAAFLNFFNLVGWVIDYATGSLFKFEPNTINVSLQKGTAMNGGDEVIYALLTIVDEDGKQSTTAVEMTPLTSN